MCPAFTLEEDFVLQRERGEGMKAVSIEREGGDREGEEGKLLV